LISKKQNKGDLMNFLRKVYGRVFFKTKGATLIEIALYIALVVIVCITAVTALGDKLQSVFQTITNSL
jgi:Flp pilus assembly pilin Flp